MTLKEAAAELGITPDTLRQQIHAGRFPATKVGRDWHVTRDEVERYAERRMSRARYAEWRAAQTPKEAA